MNSMNFNSAALTGDSSFVGERPRTATVSLAAFAPQMSRAPHGGNRVIGVMAAGAVQALLFAALMFTTFSERAAPPSAPLTVDLLPQEKVDLPPPHPPIKVVFAAPNITMAAPPTFQVYEPPPAVPMAPAANAIATTPKPAGNGNSADIVKDFQIRLLRHLNQHKRYPAIARAKRAQGVVYVRFAMDRRGNVLSASIEKGSKHEELNGEGLALLTRAQPLPLPPPEVAGDPIEMIVPVEFSLKN